MYPPQRSIRAILYTAFSRVTAMLGLTLLDEITADHFIAGLDQVPPIVAFYDLWRKRGGRKASDAGV